MIKRRRPFQRLLMREHLRIQDVYQYVQSGKTLAKYRVSDVSAADAGKGPTMAIAGMRAKTVQFTQAPKMPEGGLSRLRQGGGAVGTGPIRGIDSDSHMRTAEVGQ